MVIRTTEFRARSASERDAWMQRRIAYFGKPCLTRQEYRAVVYSLYGLPALSREDGFVVGEIELPTQRYVSSRMGASQGRVSQLLTHAAAALLWFDEQGAVDVGWHWRGKEWHFDAPVMDAPEKRERMRRVRERMRRAGDAYRLAFAGEV